MKSRIKYTWWWLRRNFRRIIRTAELFVWNFGKLRIRNIVLEKEIQRWYKSSFWYDRCSSPWCRSDQQLNYDRVFYAWGIIRKEIYIDIVSQWTWKKYPRLLAADLRSPCLQLEFSSLHLATLSKTYTTMHKLEMYIMTEQNMHYYKTKAECSLQFWENHILRSQNLSPSLICICLSCASMEAEHEKC